MKIYGYARFDADGQTLDAQAEALKAQGAAHIFCETAIGAKSERTELARAIRMLGRGDTLLVTQLDRLARSTHDLLNILGAIAKAGAGFRSIADSWADTDTTTAHGRSMLTILGGLAGFERDLVRARTDKGRERARARGQPMGRPSVLTIHQQREARAALTTGTATQADLARHFAVHHSTISRLAKKVESAPARQTLDSATDQTVRAFTKRLEGRFPVREAILYGSRARQTHNSESDADIAVILRGESGNRWEMTRELSGIAYDVLLETGIRVQPLPLWEGDLKQPERFSNPALIANIQREGLRL